MRVLLRILFNGLGLLLIAKLLPGIHYQGGLAYLLLAGIVLGLLNLLVKPILTLFSLPLIFLTFGLFYLVINGAILALADFFLDKLQIDGFLWAIAGGFVLSVFNLLVRGFEKRRDA